MVSRMPSRATLWRKWEQHLEGGLDGWIRRRKDRGRPRRNRAARSDKASALKKDPPRRAHGAIAGFLNRMGRKFRVSPDRIWTLLQISRDEIQPPCWYVRQPACQATMGSIASMHNRRIWSLLFSGRFFVRTDLFVGLPQENWLLHFGQQH